MKRENAKLIIALDGQSTEAAIQVVDTLGDRIEYYKVGMETFYGAGHIMLAQLASRGKKLVIDLKLHDLPTTVARSVKALCQFSPFMITLHAAGGPSMLKAAVAAATEWSVQTGRPRPRLVALTVLTSLNEGEWFEIGYQNQIRESVLRMSMMAREAGMDGVIAASTEAAAIRALCGTDFLIVTPGIRLASEQANDQARTSTPAQALKAGADYLMVGRPVLLAEDPVQAVESFLADMV